MTGTAEQVRDAAGSAGNDLMFPPFVSFAALGFALVLSVFKPRGRTRWAPRPERATQDALESARKSAQRPLEPARR